MVRLGSLAEIDAFFTDEPPPPPIAALLSDNDVQLFVADGSQAGHRPMPG